MKRKNNLWRVKIEFENQPIADSKVWGDDQFDRLVNNIKKKMRGSD